MGPHLLINGLSIGSGGGYTVGAELWKGIARARPHWRVTLALVQGNPLHQETRGEQTPANCEVLWAPADTARYSARARWERTGLVDFARREAAGAVLQLNGMVVAGLEKITFAHCQDPWPLRPEAWNGWKDRIKAWAKRREFKKAFQHAAFVGWTSAYLRDLMITGLGITPKRGEVFYNGMPEELLRRSAQADIYAQRLLRIVTISNVSAYKRQSLVIEVLPALLKRPGLDALTYHVAGHIEPDYRAQLEALAQRLGVGDRVKLEGRVSRERIEQLFAESRAFVLMSICESFGLPAVEAMSFGTPVVTADCCAMPEVCGNAAELVKPDDLSALEDRLAAVLLDAQRAETLRERGRTRVQSFRWEETAARMADRLQELMG